MSMRWSLKNLFLPVSCNQFKRLADHFQRSVEQGFGTDVRMTVEALSQPRLTCSFVDVFSGTNDVVDKINSENTFLKASSLGALTPEAWEKAAYVHVILKPSDATKAPPYAFAHMEVRRSEPRNVNFFVQPSGTFVRPDALVDSSYFGIGSGNRSDRVWHGIRP